MGANTLTLTESQREHRAALRRGYELHVWTSREGKISTKAIQLATVKTDFLTGEQLQWRDLTPQQRRSERRKRIAARREADMRAANRQLAEEGRLEHSEKMLAIAIQQMDMPAIEYHKGEILAAKKYLGKLDAKPRRSRLRPDYDCEVVRGQEGAVEAAQARLTTKVVVGEELIEQLRNALCA